MAAFTGISYSKGTIVTVDDTVGEIVVIGANGNYGVETNAGVVSVHHSQIEIVEDDCPAWCAVDVTGDHDHVDPFARPRRFEFEIGTTFGQALDTVKAALDDEGLTLTDADNTLFGNVRSVIADGRFVMFVPAGRIAVR